MKKRKSTTKFKDFANFDERLGNFQVNEYKESIFAYTINVKNKILDFELITKLQEKKNIIKIIKSLLRFGEESDLEGMYLNENRRDWINAILNEKSGNYDEYMKYLLRDFTDPMMTRMREQEKHVIGIIYENGIILCHSVYGEKTITPKWRVMKRMLDRHNVMRYICFTKKKENKTNITYYERRPSKFLTQWLGLRGKRAFQYLGGKNKF